MSGLKSVQVEASDAQEFIPLEGLSQIEADISFETIERTPKSGVSYITSKTKDAEIYVRANHQKYNANKKAYFWEYDQTDDAGTFVQTDFTATTNGRGRIDITDGSLVSNNKRAGYSVPDPFPIGSDIRVRMKVMVSSGFSELILAFRKDGVAAQTFALSTLEGGNDNGIFTVEGAFNSTVNASPIVFELRGTSTEDSTGAWMQVIECEIYQLNGNRILRNSTGKFFETIASEAGADNPSENEIFVNYATQGINNEVGLQCSADKLDGINGGVTISGGTQYITSNTNFAVFGEVTFDSILNTTFNALNILTGVPRFDITLGNFSNANASLLATFVSGGTTGSIRWNLHKFIPKQFFKPGDTFSFLVIKNGSVTDIANAFTLYIKFANKGYIQVSNSEVVESNGTESNASYAFNTTYIGRNSVTAQYPAILKKFSIYDGIPSSTVIDDYFNGIKPSSNVLEYVNLSSTANNVPTLSSDRTITLNANYTGNDLLPGGNAWVESKSLLPKIEYGLSHNIGINNRISILDLNPPPTDGYTFLWELIPTTRIVATNKRLFKNTRAAGNQILVGIPGVNMTYAFINMYTNSSYNSINWGSALTNQRFIKNTPHVVIQRFHTKKNVTSEYYIDGIRQLKSIPVASSILNNLEPDAATITQLFGEAFSNHPNNMTGYIVRFILWNRAITNKEIIYLSNPARNPLYSSRDRMQVLLQFQPGSFYENAGELFTKNWADPAEVIGGDPSIWDAKLEGYTDLATLRSYSTRLSKFGYK